MRDSTPIMLSGRLHFLDALRGLAAMSVMLFHFFVVGVSPVHEPLAAALPAWVAGVIQQMFCGVDVFFVLSGFVIAFSMDGQTTNLRYAGNFIMRRSLRLDPPYWVAAALMLAYFLMLWPAQWHDFYLQYGGVRGVAANLFYVQNLSFVYPAKSILDVSWTLCLEVQFYLTYLVVLVTGHYAGALMARRGERLRRAVVVLSVSTIAVWSLMCWVQHPSEDFIGQSWTFFLGVAVYGALTRGVPSIAVAVPLAILASLFAWKQEAHHLAAVAAAGAIFTAGVAGRLSTLLAVRPLLYLGKISYSLYLLHMVIGLNLLAWLSPMINGNGLAAWLAVGMAMALSLVGAQMLHRFVEAPSNRLSQRLKRQRIVPSPTHVAEAGVTSA